MGNIIRQTIPITKAGKEKLERELRRLKYEERPNIIKAISEAREHGDLSENAEYQYAKEKQSFIEGKIQELEDKLSRLEVIEPSLIKSDQVLFGAKITLLNTENDEKKIFKIVGVDEADAKLNLISIESPLARQLLNKRIGEEIAVKIPKGEFNYLITNIEYE